MSARLTAIELEWAYMRRALDEGVSFEYDVVVRAEDYVRGEPFVDVEKTFADLRSRPRYR
jgi:hypothetical protein